MLHFSMVWGKYSHQAGSDGTMPKSHKTPDMQAVRRQFAKNLVASMLKRDITGVALAKTVGVTVSSVSDWCTGRSIPSGENLYRIAMAVQETTSFLLGDHLPRKDSIGVLSRDLGAALRHRRLEALSQMKSTWLLREIDNFPSNCAAL